MKINDIVTLGKMGYSKKDIAEMDKQQGDENVAAVGEIEELRKQVADITTILQKQATRAPINQEPVEPQTPDTNSILADLLRGDAGGSN